MIPHLLSWTIFTPLIGCTLVLFAPKQAAKWIALAATSAVAVLALIGLKGFVPSQAGLQFTENILWIPQFNVHYFLGTDGISFPMVLLTALISLLACIGSFGIKEREKEYYFLYLLLCTGMMGTFLA